LPDKDVSSRVGQRTENKEMEQYLSCYPLEIPSHKVTPIQRRMTGAILLLKLGDGDVCSC